MFRDEGCEEKHRISCRGNLLYKTSRKRFQIRIAHNLNVYWTRLGVFRAVLELSWRRLGHLEDVNGRLGASAGHFGDGLGCRADFSS